MQTRKKGPKGPKAPKGSGAAANAEAKAKAKASGPKTKTPDVNFNFSPAEFLRCIRDAALSVSALTSEEEESVRLTTCLLAPLSHSLHSLHSTETNNKKRPSCDSHTHNAEAPPSSSKRHRKKSKYLSPPYTHTHTPIIQKQNLHFHAFSVPHLFNLLLFTAIHPLSLYSTSSANLLRLFLPKFRDTMSLQSCLSPQMATVSRTKEELQRVTGKDDTHNGANQPNKQGWPTKGEKSLSTLASIMPRVEQSEQKNERKDFAGSVSSVTYQTNINVGSETVLNFANGSCDFLEQARAQMMETSSMGKGNKLAATGKQSQEQGGSSNKCNTGNGDATCDTGPKQKGRKKKIAQAHYQNPAALLFDFSKPDTTDGAAIGTGMDLPSRDQLLSTFSKFGLLVEAQSLVYPDAHTARVVFARSADAEVACNSPDKLGPFGPPYASCRLRYLPPISDLTTAAQRVQAPQIPAQQLSAKPQLSDVRKNLEIMISSLTGGSGLLVKQEPGSALDGIRPEVRGLLGEMQGLLTKVDKRLGNGGASSCAPQP